MILELIADRFNYAFVIVLMMAGLYVLFSSGNLVKKLVGLSVFQTSVFLLYISMAKVSGGQPPILDLDHEYEGGHSGEIVETHAGDVTTDPVVTEPHSEAITEPEDTALDAEEAPDEADLIAPIEETSEVFVEVAEDSAGEPEPIEVNGAEPESLIEDSGQAEHITETESQYAAAPEDTHGASAYPSDPNDESFRRYSNPLPHVLILTAIVVGVATLAVGLALVVRIREVYGTIEDDEISAADYDTAAGGAS